MQGIQVRPAGRELGVKAWRMNVLEIEAACNGYPEHNHREDGTGSFIRVPADGSRKLKK